MPWVLVDVLLAVLAVLVTGAVAFALYRRVRVLTRALSAASERLAAVAPPAVQQPDTKRT